MMKRWLMVLLLALWFPFAATAATYQALPNVSITIPDLPATWKVTTEATDEMVEHLAEHVKEEAEQQGRMMTEKEALNAARDRLKREELILFSESDAHILISFEARGDGEAVPTQSDVRRSAEFAAAGVEDEGWVDPKVRFSSATVKGAQVVQRFGIEYKHEGEIGYFNGLVGYAEPFWFWVYATDHGENPADKDVIDGILSNMTVTIK